MVKFEKQLALAGVLTLLIALFQALIGFSPSLSLYFGAPKALVINSHLLIVVSMLVAAFLAIFGCYAIAGAGLMRPLPWLRPMLVVISILFLLRGLLVIPELLVVLDVIDASIPVAPRFILFSLGSLLMGWVYSSGVLNGWNDFL